MTVPARNLSPTPGARHFGSAGAGLHMTEGQLVLPGPEWVGIRTHDLFGERAGRVVARLNETSPVVLAGGGWESVARPLRRGIPQWRGHDAPQMVLSLIIDGHPRTSVEADCRALQKMAGAIIPGDPEPPKLVVWGQMIPAEAKWGNHLWVISEPPGWDTSPDGTVRRADGQRVRQAVDVTLMLASDDDELRRVKAAQAKPRYRRIKSRKGDTFEKIAARELGSKRYAHKLAALNGRGGGSVSVELPRNTSVKVPTGDLLAEWKRDLARAK